MESTEPASKRPRLEASSSSSSSSSVSLRAKGPNGVLELTVESSLLTSEFFKAKLDRWEDGEELNFDLPDETDVGGLSLLVDRMKVGEAVSWHPLDWWWKVPDGNPAKLFAVLWLTDLLLLEAYCKEVAGTFRTLDILLPQHFQPIIKANPNLESLAVQEPLLVSPITQVSSDDLTHLVQTSLERNDSVKIIADRAMAAAPIDQLRAALLSGLKWIYSQGKHAIGKYKDTSLPWLGVHIVQQMHRDPTFVGQTLDLVEPGTRDCIKIPFSRAIILWGLGSLLYGSCKLHHDPEQRQNLMTVIPKTVAAADLVPWGELAGDALAHFLDHISTLFGAAHVEVQLAILKLPKSKCEDILKILLRGAPRNVRPEARRALLSKVHLLSAEDLELLSKQPFPPPS